MYDYYLRDHLGNVRTVLTEEKDTALYPIASLESAQLSNEKLYYFGEDSGRINKSGVSGYPTDNTTSPNDYIQQLSGSGYKIGTGIVLKVMAGDQVLIKATSWYNKNGVTPGTPSSPLSALISALISGVGGVTNAAHGITPTQLQNSGVLIPGATAFYGSHNSADSTTKPKAFLNWILLDDQFKYVASSSGFDQVGSDQQFKSHYVTPTMAKNGFLYVYVSNETPNINVYFDNLTVTHIKSPLLQEQSYYPFGLQMAGISDKTLGKLDSKYKFDGGVEFEEDYGVNLYETFYRGYDPQIGRFNGVDIMSEKTAGMSVYGYCSNNPEMFNDPMGSDQAAMSHRGSLTLYGSDIGDAGYDPFGWASNPDVWDGVDYGRGGGGSGGGSGGNGSGNYGYFDKEGNGYFGGTNAQAIVAALEKAMKNPDADGNWAFTIQYESFPIYDKQKKLMGNVTVYEYEQNDIPVGETAQHGVTLVCGFNYSPDYDGPRNQKWNWMQTFVSNVPGASDGAKAGQAYYDPVTPDNDPHYYYDNSKRAEDPPAPVTSFGDSPSRPAHYQNVTWMAELNLMDMNDNTVYGSFTYGWVFQNGIFTRLTFQQVSNPDLYLPHK